MNKKIIIILSVFLSLLSGSVYANCSGLNWFKCAGHSIHKWFTDKCYYVDVTNNSDANLYVFWTAMGCGGVSKNAGAWAMCYGPKEVGPNKTVSYGFKKGVTAPVIKVARHSDEGIYFIYYKYRNGDFWNGDGFEGSPGSCKQQHYNISVSQNRVNENL